MKKSLLQNILPIVEQLKILQQELTENKLGTEIRNSFITTIDEFSKKSTENGIDPRAVELAKYAIVALIDETALNSSWEYRQQWLNSTLQQYYFKESIAGEGFFRNLKMLQENDKQDIELLEIYCLCMELGFKGEYKSYNEHELVEKLNKLRNTVIEHRQKQYHPPIANVSKTNKKPIPKAKLFLATQIIILLAGVLSIYFSYNHMINRKISNIKRTIASKQHENIE